MPDPIRLALIGAGLFAREAHLPALQALGQAFEIVAVYSRTRDSAERLASLLPQRPDIYTELSDLLACQDIEAVDVVLPVLAMPDAVEQALASGKHIMSEKPLAPTVAIGQRLLARQQPGQVWLVAENWRYEPAFLQAAEIIQSGELGKLLVAHWALHVAMTPENKYYHTPWRREGSFPGGFLMDGGVHHIAALRLVLGEIVEVSAFAVQLRDDLPPTDTLSAGLRFESGIVGSYTVTYAAGSKLDQTLHVVGDRGTLRVNRTILEVLSTSMARSASFQAKSVDAELAAFAAAIREGQTSRNTPQQALQDVAVIEALLKSAAEGKHFVPQRVVP